MPDYTLPFPGRELADQELTYDVCYAKILPQDRASIVERAWRKGEQAARDIFVKYGGETDFFKIAADSGLVCECVDTEPYSSVSWRYPPVGAGKWYDTGNCAERYPKP